jgi:branched-chain amino acid aminotransferase
MNSQLIKMEAMLDGYEEGIALNIRGHVSEGSGENLFLVMDGTVLTPPLSSSVLPGITRNTVMTLFREMGVKVVEETIPREMLYVADEVFFTGSAAEVTPIRSIDKIVVGTGKRGPLTERVQKAFFDVIEGKTPDAHGWLTFV